VGWVDAELVLVAIAAGLSPTTLTVSVLALVLGDRPLRTGVWSSRRVSPTTEV
jgi:hypothetical protein